MLTGLPPFYDENTNEMYRKILQEPLTFPSSDIVPPAARDLLTRLLNRDPQRRLGANGAAEIKSHHFFANRRTQEIQLTSTVSLPLRHPKTRTSKVRYCHRPCNNSLKGGLTTAPLRVSVMPVAVSWTRRLKVFRSEFVKSRTAGPIRCGRVMDLG